MVPLRMRSFLVDRALKWHRWKCTLADKGNNRIYDPLPASTFHCKDGRTSAALSDSSIFSSVCSKDTSYPGYCFKGLASCRYLRFRSICSESGELRSSENNGKVANTSGSKASAIPSRQRLGPSVRRLLIETGIDVATLKGTGPGGVVVKGDVIAAMKSGSKSKNELEVSKSHKASTTSKVSSEASSFQFGMLHHDLPTSHIQKVIARRLSQSKEGIPHLYLSADAVLDATLALTQELKAHNLHISLNDFFIKAVASALRQVPEANAHWDEKLGVVSGSSVDISIAVATEKGLMTPILRNADQKSLSDISIKMKQLTGEAHEGKLQPNDFEGGSFSISNLGMFNVDHFCAVINPPQACILAIGCGESSVVWQEDPFCPGQGRPKAVTKVRLTLSADHRVVDVDIGGKFLDTLGQILRDPRAHLL